MTDWFIETGFGYPLGVAAVTLVGSVLLYRGLWGDRSRGRTRCPKCWYDMRGTVPRLECPECGYDAREKRRLYKHRRRWGRVVIGVALVLLSAFPLAIVGGWWREQSAMRRYGITLTEPTNWQVRVRALQERIGPAWLVNRLPDKLGRFFERVDRLTVVAPEELVTCRSLRHLRWVGVFNSDMQTIDADLLHLKGLSKLERLDLSATPVTDAGRAHLKGLSKLKRLGLLGTKVTNVGVAELEQALPNVIIVR